MREGARQARLLRLRRIEGQVRGLSRMIDERRACAEILTQLRAVRAALKRVEDQVLREHVERCVRHAFSAGTGSAQRAEVEELLALLGRFSS